MARLLGRASRIANGPKNANSRFDVADALNRACGSSEGPFWGTPVRAATHARSSTQSFDRNHTIRWSCTRA